MRRGLKHGRCRVVGSERSDHQVRPEEGKNGGSRRQPAFRPSGYDHGCLCEHEIERLGERAVVERSSIVALSEHDRLRGMGAEGPLSMIPNCRSRRTMSHEWPEPAPGLSDAKLAARAQRAKAKKG